MKLASSTQMRALDAEAIKLGIPGVVLMENAARSIFESISALEAYKPKRAVIYCGTGNNGGDGFALARHMANDGAAVTVIIAGDTSKIKGDARINYDACVNMGIEINKGLYSSGTQNSPLVIDAFLGTGVSGGLRGDVKDAVILINQMKNNGAYVVSIDCPTGGNPDNGKVEDRELCVRADLTVSLGLIKTGLLVYPLAEYTGRLEIGQIGIPSVLIDKAETGCFALDAESAAECLPKRRARSHKGTYGKVSLIAGSRGMAGAAAFCAKAAYMVGCGYVYACVPEGIAPIIQQLVPQALITCLPEKDGHAFEGSVEAALEKINSSTACLIGPGLGNAKETAVFVKEIIKNTNIPMIIDADALNALAGAPEVLKTAKRTPTITPHPLEMSRLSGSAPDRILNSMLESAIGFSEKYGTVTVLKDAATIISGEGKTFINSFACPALAKAGSGDVLAGIIAGLAAQGAKALDAAALGAYVHSQSGIASAKKYGNYSVSPEALIESIADVMVMLNGK